MTAQRLRTPLLPSHYNGGDRTTEDGSTVFLLDCPFLPQCNRVLLLDDRHCVHLVVPRHGFRRSVDARCLLINLMHSILSDCVQRAGKTSDHRYCHCNDANAFTEQRQAKALALWPSRQVRAFPSSALVSYCAHSRCRVHNHPVQQRLQLRWQLRLTHVYVVSQTRVPTNRLCMEIALSLRFSCLPLIDSRCQYRSESTMKLTSPSYKRVLRCPLCCISRCFEATVLYRDCPNLPVLCTSDVLVVLALAVLAFQSNRCGMETDSIWISNSRPEL